MRPGLWIAWAKCMATEYERMMAMLRQIKAERGRVSRTSIVWKPPERIKYQTAVAQWPTEEAAAQSQLYSPLTTPNLFLEQRTWVPAMVPWRASEQGEVTQDVIDWYARFAQGRPGAIVIEATGIRDIPSGPLLRISDDRYVAGLRQLTDTVREASGGRTRLLIQLIDFLTIRRRPQPEIFFNRFLEVTATHRQRLDMEREDEQTIRQRLLSLSDSELQDVLSSRELESLREGYRERVTDTHLPGIAALPETLPLLFSQAATESAGGGVRRRRVALRARLHHGLFPVCHQYPDRWLRR